MRSFVIAGTTAKYREQRIEREPQDLFDNLDTLLIMVRDGGSVSQVIDQLERVTEYILDFEEAWSLAPICHGDEQLNREIFQTIIDAVATISDNLTRMDEYAGICQSIQPVTEFVDRARRRVRQDQASLHFG
jgi:hypothetical protein